MTNKVLILTPFVVAIVLGTVFAVKKNPKIKTERTCSPISAPVKRSDIWKIRPKCDGELVVSITEVYNLWEGYNFEGKGFWRNTNTGEIEEVIGEAK